MAVCQPTPKSLATSATESSSCPTRRQISARARSLTPLQARWRGGAQITYQASLASRSTDPAGERLDTAVSTGGELRPIEPHLRAESPLDDLVLIVRAGPLNGREARRAHTREQERYSYRARPMASISADATVGGWMLQAVLPDRLW
ncbi:MAG TPA: hypothetical protein VK988_10915 [Acidimicrobiales bacterium]|nr:hypothetical protein [Acidimicrobiales bacterium]